MSPSPPPIKEHAWRNFERGGDSADILDADVSFSAFDTPDITSIKLRMRREFFLRPASLPSQIAHPFAEERLYIGVSHAIDSRLLRTPRPRTMRTKREQGHVVGN